MKLPTKIFGVLTVLMVAMISQFCTSTKQPTQESAKISGPVVSYATDIKPVMLQSCTPCHFPDQGKKKMLDTYESTKANIQDILTRVQLPEDEIKYMPFKSKKPALTSEEIMKIKRWVAQGFPN